MIENKILEKEEMEELIQPKLVNLEEVLDTEKRYIIPIYQRPYDWDEEHINKLINTLLNKDFKRYIFLGNMEFINSSKEERIQIIDGQQRITTLLILGHLLKKYSKDELEKMLKIEIQSDEQDKENEQKKFSNLLKEFESKSELDIIEEISNKIAGKEKQKTKNIERLKNENVYKLNYYFLYKAMEKAVKTENEEEDDEKKTNKQDDNMEKLEELKEKLKENLKNTYIVVLNIKGKGKNKEDKGILEYEAINMFDVINTTGKPLETKDIFKIKMYEYSKNVLGKESNDENVKVINNINKLYNNIKIKKEKIAQKEDEIKLRYKEEIKEEIKKCKKDVDINEKGARDSDVKIISEIFSIEDILKVYKYILISRVKNGEVYYKRDLIRMGYEKFYELLFSKLLNGINIKEFNGFEKEIISEKELDGIYKCYEELSTRILELKNIESDTYFAYKMLNSWNTRYKSYSFLPVIVLWRFYLKYDGKEWNPETLENQYNSSKWSIKNTDKQFEEFIVNISKFVQLNSIIHGQVKDDVKKFLDKIIEDIVTSNKNIKEINEEIKNKLKETIEADTLDNKLDSDIAKNPKIKNITCLILAKKEEKAKLRDYEKLFTIAYDIEHIHAIKNINENLGEENENKLGNLMILESWINRTIQNRDIEEKVEIYKKSKFGVVQKYVNSSEKDTNFKTRHDRNIEIVKKYFEINK